MDVTNSNKAIIEKEIIMQNQRPIITTQPRSILENPRKFNKLEVTKKIEKRLDKYTSTIDQLTLEDALATKQNINIIIDQLENMLKEKVVALKKRLTSDNSTGQSSSNIDEQDE